MSKKIVYLLFVIYLIVGVSYGQPLVEWTNSDNQGGVGFIHQLPDGGYIVAGDMTAENPGHNYAISELNPDGSIRWTNRVGDSELMVCEAGCATSDGGYVMVGQVTITEDSAVAQACKVNAFGDSLWTRRYPVGVATSLLFGVCEVPGGDLLMCGSFFVTADNRQGLLIRTDSDGNTIWTQDYGGTGTQFFRSQICPTHDGYYLMAGESILPDRIDCWLVKVNAAGTLQFEQRYGGDNIDRANAVVERITGDYVIGGHTYSFGVNGGSDAWLVLVTNSGDSLASRTYDDGGSESCQNLVATTDGGVVQVSSKWVSGPPGFDAWIIKTDWHGNTQWMKTMGGNNSDALRVVIQAADGGFLLSGSSGSPGYTGPGAWLVKLGDEGPHSLAIKLHYGTPHLKLIWKTSLPGDYAIYSTDDPDLTTEPPGTGWDYHVTVSGIGAGNLSWDHDNAIRPGQWDQRRYVVRMTTE